MRMGCGEPVRQLVVDLELRLLRELVERAHRSPSRACTSSASPNGMMRKASCAVGCGSARSSRSGAVGTQPPKPTSASQGAPSSVTRSAMCVRGRGGAPGGAIQRTRPTRLWTSKPSAASTRWNRRVVLVAVAAAAGPDQLRVDRRRRQVDAPIQQHVDRLERRSRPDAARAAPAASRASACAAPSSRSARNRRRGRPAAPAARHRARRRSAGPPAARRCGAGGPAGCAARSLARGARSTAGSAPGRARSGRTPGHRSCRAARSGSVEPVTATPSSPSSRITVSSTGERPRPSTRTRRQGARRSCRRLPVGPGGAPARSASAHQCSCRSIVAMAWPGAPGSSSRPSWSNLESQALAKLTESRIATACTSANTRRSCSTARRPPEMPP